MRINKLLSTALLSLLGVTAIAPAYALDAPGQDAAGNVYLTGGVSGQKYTVLYKAMKKQDSKTADECGIVKVSKFVPQSDTPTGWPKFDGSSLTNVQTVNSTSTPKCTNGVPALPGNQNGIYRVYDATTDSYAYYFTGKTPFAKYIWESGNAVTRTITGDRCGMLKLSSSGDYAGYAGDISIDYGALTATIPTTGKISTAGPVCKYGDLLKPSGW